MAGFVPIGPHIVRLRVSATAALVAASSACGTAGTLAREMPVLGADGGSDDGPVGSVDAYACGGCGGTCLKGRCLVKLASGLGPNFLAVNSTRVYWTNTVDGMVMSAPTGGGLATTLASGGDDFGIALGSTGVYWTNRQLGTVMSEPLGGGKATTLASGLNGPLCIAVDSTSAYWTEGDRVMKVPLGGGTPTTLASGLVDATASPSMARASTGPASSARDSWEMAGAP